MTAERKPHRPCPTLSQSEPKNPHRTSQDTKDQLKNELISGPVAPRDRKRSSTLLSASSAYTPLKRSKQKSRSIGSLWTEGTSAQRPYAIENSDSEGDPPSPTRILFPAVANQANYTLQTNTGNGSHSEGNSPPPMRSLPPAIATAVSPQSSTAFAERPDTEDTNHSVDVQADLDLPSDEENSDAVSESSLTEGYPRKFYKKYQGSKSIIEVARTLWDEMAKEAFVTGKGQANDYGCIYILSNADYPEYVKIGRTTKNPDQRKQQWSKLCKSELDLVDQDSQSLIEVPFHTRLEGLIKHDLRNEHHSFVCVPCSKRRSGGRFTRHSEWFKIGRNEALLRVEAWRKWARCNPYDENGLLKKEWENRINRLRRDSNAKKMLETEDEEGRRFESFLKEFSWLSSIEQWFCEPRLEPDGKLCSSRYTSLRTHWKSLFVFCVLHYAGSCIVAWCGAPYIGALLTVASTVFAV